VRQPKVPLPALRRVFSHVLCNRALCTGSAVAHLGNLGPEGSAGASPGKVAWNVASNGLAYSDVRTIPGYFKVMKEITRHLLRRPVVGIVAAAHTTDGRWLLIRRGDTGEWALPGGTLEWGETLRDAIVREIEEEAGVTRVILGDVIGVYSNLDRDPRFHSVTVVADAIVEAPTKPPMNPVEVLEVRLFSVEELPQKLSHGMTDMFRNAETGTHFWE